MLGNIKIGMRLKIGFGAVLLILLITGLVGYWGINSVSGTTIKMLQGDANIAEYSARARANVLALRRYEKDIFLNIGSKEKEEEYVKKWKEQSEHLSARISDIEKVVELEKDKDLVASMKNNLAAYDSGFNKVYGMIKEGQIKTPQDGNAAIGAYKEQIHKMEQTAKDFADEGNKRMDAALPTVKAITNRTVSIMAILVLASIIISIAISSIITRSITQPLYKAVDVSDSLAQGDLTVDIEVNSNDETGHMLSSMKKMTDSLRNIMSSISQSSNHIASSSEQLSASSTQIAKGAEAQTQKAAQVATAAEQMSATVIEVAKNAS
ncbi:MAG: methyl-accepting chemotaxis protein, partial [Deltaproteobacteria bacterium]|nr:methyl-accepting chemotaxis protein [Deltaproteobacteria bacterium]